MPRKKKEPPVPEEIDIELLCQIDDVYVSLTEKYFELARSEVIGLTAAVTRKLDKLESDIRKRKEELLIKIQIK